MNKIIEQKLKEIEEKENVKIILAVESGSRAWGFASPDSDYDVRFIYVRETKEYLKLNEIRDVIEWQLDETLDISGWDIKKALKLLYKTNPTLFEWFSSPIVYKKTEEFEKLKKLLPQYFSSKKSLYHYLNMAKTTYRKYLKEEKIRMKKYFYVLRPLLAAKWILDKKTYPPMEFSKLLNEELKNDEKVKMEIEKLLKKKIQMLEMDYSEKIEILNEYIEKNFEIVEENINKITDEKHNWEKLNKYFHKILKKPKI